MGKKMARVILIFATDANEIIVWVARVSVFVSNARKRFAVDALQPRNVSVGMGITAKTVPQNVISVKSRDVRKRFALNAAKLNCFSLKLVAWVVSN